MNSIATTIQTIKLLVIADEFDLPNLVVSKLRQLNFSVHTVGVSKKQELIDHLLHNGWDVLLYLENDFLTLMDAQEQLKLAGSGSQILMVSDKADSADYNLLEMQISDILPKDNLDNIAAKIIQAASAHQNLLAKNRLDRQIIELEKRNETLFEQSKLAVSYIQDGMHMKCNSAWAALFGHSDKNYLKMIPLLDLVFEQDSEKLQDILNTKLTTEEVIYVHSAKKPDDLYGLELRVMPITINNQYCLQIIADSARDKHEFLSDHAGTDGEITFRLDYKDLFLDQVEAAINDAINNNKYSSLLVIEIQNFDDLLLILGEENVNRIFSQIRDFLINNLHVRYSSGRLSDNKFALLLQDNSPEYAQSLTKYIKRKLLDQLVTVDMPPIHFYCAVGFSIINNYVKDAANVLENTMASMDVILEHKNVDSDSTITQGIEIENRNLLQHIGNAIENNLFTTYFQPIVNIKSEGADSYELLTRLIDANNNEIPPYVFFPHALTHNLGSEIDKCVINSAFNLLEDKGVDEERFVVNLTSNSLANEEFLKWLIRKEANSEIASERLVIQLSEVDIYKASENIHKLAKAFAKMKIPLSISHFGTAINPFEFFDIIKPEFVKLDNSLISELPYNAAQLSELKTLVEKVHSLDCKIVVPHIENIDLMPILWELGVECVQGYFLKEPSQDLNYEFLREQEITLNATDS